MAGPAFFHDRPLNILEASQGFSQDYFGKEEISPYKFMGGKHFHMEGLNLGVGTEHAAAAK